MEINTEQVQHVLTVGALLVTATTIITEGLHRLIRRWCTCPRFLSLLAGICVLLAASMLDIVLGLSKINTIFLGLLLGISAQYFHERATKSVTSAVEVVKQKKDLWKV